MVFVNIMLINCEIELVVKFLYIISKIYRIYLVLKKVCELRFLVF